MPPWNGSFRMNTSPGSILPAKASLIAAIAVGIEPRWPGRVSPCATSMPVAVEHRGRIVHVVLQHAGIGRPEDRSAPSRRRSENSAFLNSSNSIGSLIIAASAAPGAARLQRSATRRSRCSDENEQTAFASWLCYSSVASGGQTRKAVEQEAHVGHGLARRAAWRRDDANAARVAVGRFGSSLLLERGVEDPIGIWHRGVRLNQLSASIERICRQQSAAALGARLFRNWIKNEREVGAMKNRLKAFAAVPLLHALALAHVGARATSRRHTQDRPFRQPGEHVDARGIDRWRSTGR